MIVGGNNLDGCRCKGNGNPRNLAMSLRSWHNQDSLSGVELSGVEDDWIPTASQLGAGTNDLDLKVRTLNKEISGSPTRILASWNVFLQEWNVWKDQWWIRSWKRRGELLSYRQRFNELLSAFVKAGGRTTLVAFTAEQATGEDPDKPSFTQTIEKIGTYALILGLVVGGGYALGKLTGAVREVRR